MRVVNLSSGSKGNCTYIETRLAKILIDDGISLKNLTSRLNEISVNVLEIDAILLTHEHSDHIYGIKAFLKKNKHAKVYIPAFVQSMCLPNIFVFPPSQVVWFTSSTFFVKDVLVNAFVLPHDSHFCVGYSVISENRKISIATDLGFISKDTLNSLENSDILYLESNHDEKLLIKNPKYSAHLKKRILSKKGHLSNVASAEAICYLVTKGVKQVVLSHLSEENNTPELAYSTVKNILFKNGIIEGEHVCIDVSYQDKIGTIFEL